MLCTVAHCGLSRRGSRLLRLAGDLGNAHTPQCDGKYLPVLVLHCFFPVLGRVYLSKDHFNIRVLRAVENIFITLLRDSLFVLECVVLAGPTEIKYFKLYKWS